MHTSLETIALEQPRPSWLKSRLRTVLNHVGAAGMTLATGGYARWVAPYQIEYTQRAMPLRNLPASFAGFRIVQLSDLHTSLCTPARFLRQVIARTNEMRPDLVVVTGDLVSHRMKDVPLACELLGELRGPTVVTFGNHDYAPSWNAASSTVIADALQADLEARGLTVLRNRAWPIEHADGRLWLVGLEDLWSGRFAPAVAFRDVVSDEPIIALSHNPDTAFALERFGAQWILAGHTHGGQIRIPVAGAVVLPVRHKKFDKGEFRIGQSRMYVTRGMGFRLPVRFRCPPEVTTFTLEREGG